MISLNKIILIGNLGSNPEMRMTGKGTPVVEFSLAVNEAYVDSSGNSHKRTEWFRIRTWDKLATICNQFLSKGKTVYVEGSIHSQEYEKDGVKHRSYEITAQKVIFLFSNKPTEPVDAEIEEN